MFTIKTNVVDTTKDITTVLGFYETRLTSYKEKYHDQNILNKQTLLLTLKSL